MHVFTLDNSTKQGHANLFSGHPWILDNSLQAIRSWSGKIVFTSADCSAGPFGRSEKANLVGVSAVQRWDVGREGVTARVEVEVKLDVVTCSQSGEAVTFMQIR